MQICGIYIFKRIKDNSPVYVGQTSNIDNKNYITSSVVLLSRLKNNGSEWFWNYYKKEYLCTFLYNKNKLNNLETFFINFYKTHIDYKNNGYNYNYGGDGNFGYKFTLLQKQKVSIGVINNRSKNPLTSKQLKNYTEATIKQHKTPSINRLNGYKKTAQKLKGKIPHNLIVFTEDENEKIIQLRNNNISYDKIAKQLGYSKPTIIKQFKRIKEASP